MSIFLRQEPGYTVADDYWTFALLLHVYIPLLSANHLLPTTVVGFVSYFALGLARKQDYGCI